MRVNFESATDFQFKCQECGQLLNVEDNQSIIKDLRGQIKEIENFLKTYD